MAKEPQLISFNVFLNEDGTEVTSVQIHPDAASMDFHMQVLGEEMSEWVERGEFIELKHIEIYGTPSAASWKLISHSWTRASSAVASSLHT